MDKLTAMQSFVTVAAAGSFTAAADILGVPKSRVSQRISDLERELGVRLLNRSTRALQLTADGAAYETKCRAILQDIEELEAILAGGARSPAGPLRVEALVSIARWVIAPRLHLFQDLYPAISLRMGASDRISHLLEDGIDVAIRGGRLDDSSQIARHVCDIEMGLYASPAYVAAAGTVRGPADLTGHRRLSWFGGPRDPFSWSLASDDRLAEVPGGDGLRFDDPDVAIAACAAGAGICPGAPFAVETLVRGGQLVPVLPQWHFPARPVHILYASNSHLSARVRCFVDWAAGVMRADEGLRLTPRSLAESL